MPQSMMMMSSPYSTTVMFLPTSLRPPRGMTRSFAPGIFFRTEGAAGLREAVLGASTATVSAATTTESSAETMEEPPRRLLEGVFF